MHDIDFLPASYHERRLRVRLWLWRFAVLAGFGCIICSVAVMQLAQYQRAKKQLAQMKILRVAAQDKSENLTLLHSKLAEANEFADLYTYLTHPWPRTQLLSAIAKPLPPTMSLSELSISRASAPSDHKRLTMSHPAATDQPGQNERPARTDFDRLRAVCDDSVSVVRLTGETSDTTDVYRFVATLEASPLFISAELESLESVSSEQSEAWANFNIRLVVRPGYGQSDGPSQPPTALASTSRRNAESTLP